MTKMKDRLWLWGQEAGSHHAALGNQTWKLPGNNLMGPAEGAAYLGINNMCRVVMGGKPEPPFDAESEKLKLMDQVIWSAVGDSGSVRNNADQSDLGEVLRQAEKYSNITGAVLDDFFINPEFNEGRVARHSLESIARMRDNLHNFKARPLDLWVVWYKRQLDWPVAEYLDLFDVITYWNMRTSTEFAEIDRDFGKVVSQTPGKRRVLGCYMWSYGGGVPLTIAEIQAQCEKFYGWIKEGKAEGIIFCSNCCADLGLEAVKWVRDWIRQVGNEEV